MTITRTSRAPRLAAAVLGVAALAGGLAAPALAASESDLITDDHGLQTARFVAVDPSNPGEALFRTWYSYEPEDLTLTAYPVDDQAAPFLDYADPTEPTLDQTPLAWDTDVFMDADAAGTELVHVVPWTLLHEYTSEVSVRPSHGEVLVFGRTTVEGLRLLAWYIPEEGFAGTDTFEITHRMDGTAHVETVTVEVGSEVPARIDGVLDAPDGVVNAGLLDLQDQDTAETVARYREIGGFVGPDTDGEHTVPGTVETGGEASWLLAGGAALAAGGLLAARRRLGLAS